MADTHHPHPRPPKPRDGTPHRLVKMTLALGENRPAWMLDAERQLAESAGLRRLAAMMDLPEELLACRGQHPHPGLEWLGKHPAGGKTDV